MGVGARSERGGSGVTVCCSAQGRVVGGQLPQSDGSCGWRGGTHRRGPVSRSSGRRGGREASAALGPRAEGRRKGWVWARLRWESGASGGSSEGSGERGWEEGRDRGSQKGRWRAFEALILREDPKSNLTP
ncbi:hypothetical protein OsI_35796 [Oryza sativa Indica Group]|uniref:Uncharacterized protein n=3 Tax=Oryza sativa TaxID=4530 RepID=A3CAG5_ORYSJ|nr:hypothetical protein LOC_Os11g17620 [Oryza sativa Japonica Group]ABA92627.1 hypothetical protein LOC_Os11g17620 [Oryza sativa Japonica Group]EAY80616.1 hypothetical protein OsI_35796 [Oryza sativa Indica Group]EAZ18078.1 hypothetical protein OsJ_33625 [Oryza sativa Japonica Group]